MDIKAVKTEAAKVLAALEPGAEAFIPAPYVPLARFTVTAIAAFLTNQAASSAAQATHAEAVNVHANSVADDALSKAGLVDKLGSLVDSYIQSADEARQRAAEFKAKFPDGIVPLNPDFLRGSGVPPNDHAEPSSDAHPGFVRAANGELVPAPAG